MNSRVSLIEFLNFTLGQCSLLDYVIKLDFQVMVVHDLLDFQGVFMSVKSL